MKISIPISLKKVNSETLPIYYEQIKKACAERVFLCFPGSLCTSSGLIRRSPEVISEAIKYFRAGGIEVGVWVDSFGHGRPLYSSETDPELEKYQPMVGLDGGSTPYGLCPLGESFEKDYIEGIKLLAALGPDLIMLDDDFRFNRGNAYYMGCFCPKHIKMYEKLLGESVSPSRLSELIYSGGKNKYRTAYMDMMRNTLESFAAKLRAAIDEIDPKIRLGACSVRESVDYNGTDPARIAKILAGSTKPFTRTSGAPYGGADVIPPIEFTRLQLASLSDKDIETMTEGDTYPRPRYACSYRVLALYNLALIADGSDTGRLDYLIDYNSRPDYEVGYLERYAKEKPIREGLAELFAGLSPFGIRVYNKTHKLREWELPEKVDPTLVKRLPLTAENPAAYLLSKNSIPTTYKENELPLIILGENARDIDRALLKNGAILDAASAKILSALGVDTGLISAEPICSETEYFIKEDDSITDVDGGALYGMTAREGAVIHSVYPTDGADISSRTNRVASYSYTNDDGESFLVLGIDRYLSARMPNYDNSYHRQALLISWIEARGVRLPLVSLKNPNLYTLAAKGDDRLAVLLLNVHLDDIEAPKIRLDGEYGSIEFLGCSGKLSGDTVTLSDISPYGFAAFKVTK